MGMSILISKGVLNVPNGKHWAVALKYYRFALYWYAHKTNSPCFTYTVIVQVTKFGYILR